MRASSLLVGLALLAAGCPPPVVAEAPPKPAEGRKAWVDAVTAGDAERAWALMSPGSRARWSDKASFTRWCAKHCASVAVHTMALRDPPRELARVGDTVLVKEAGGWRVLRSLDDGPPATPQAALAGLRALAADQLSAPLLAPSATDRLRRLIAGLDRLLAPGATLPEPDGARLDVPLGPDITVRLERSRAGSWQVRRWGP